jgi:PAS domain S-box-containing protein
LNPPWRQRRPSEQRAWAWAALAAAFTSYLLAFLYLGPSAGATVTVLYALPCVMAGWAFGSSGGMLVALLTAPIHAWLFASGVIPPVVEGTAPALLGLSAALLVGVTVGGARDVRERLHEKTMLLMESEDRYRQLVDNSPEGVLVHERGVVMFANPSMARLVGAPTADSLVGRTLVTLAPFEDRAAFETRFVHAKPGPIHLEARFEHVLGGAVGVELRSMPIQYRGAHANLVLVREHALPIAPVRYARAGVA